MLSIYRYSSATAFLKDSLTEKKKKNAAFSLRAWSRTLGFQGHAPLHLMVGGKRPIPRKYIPQFISALGLSAKEGLYFETLVDLERSHTVPQKEFYMNRLKEISPREPVKLVELESFRTLGDPLHFMILEMTALPDFESTAKWIQSRLTFKVQLSRVQDAVDRMIGLGLLREEADGRWVKTNAHLTNRADIADKGSQEYHKNISFLAAEQISEQAPLDREYNGYALNIKKSSLPRAKVLVREFVKKFIEEIEAPAGLGDETYQFNVQLFSLTQPKKNHDGGNSHEGE